MPKKLEQCVQKVKKNIKPRKGQDKESAAWAVCTAAWKRGAKNGR